MSDAQRAAVGRYLGQDADTDAGRLRSALWQSFSRNLPRVGDLYLHNAARLLRRVVPVPGK